VEIRRPTTLTQTVHSASECTEQLARFFPDASPVQVRAVLTPLRNGTGKVRESVLVEFASSEKAIFSSSLPLEFDDRVCLKRAEGQGESDARVIAVRYQEGRRSVAVKFADGQGSWVKWP
jgi:hypothetical protein